MMGPGPTRLSDLPGVFARLIWHEYREWRRRRALGRAIGAFLDAPSVVRRHDPACKAVCGPGCETDAQFRARVREAVKS